MKTFLIAKLRDRNGIISQDSNTVRIIEEEVRVEGSLVHQP